MFSQMNKEFLIFLFFLFLSGMFWLMMTLNETYEQEICVPVKLAGQPTNVVVTSEPDDTLKVTFYLARSRVVPDSVVIYADRHLLDSIRYVTTEPLRIVNFSDTVVRKVSLARIRGVKMVPAEVRVALYPDVLTEESMEVPVKAINMPDGKVLRTFPSKVKVRFTVGVSMFRNVRPEQFAVVVDYNELAAAPSPQCTLRLKAMPHGVRSARLEMPQVDYLIEQQ